MRINRLMVRSFWRRSMRFSSVLGPVFPGSMHTFSRPGLQTAGRKLIISPGLQPRGALNIVLCTWILGFSQCFVPLDGSLTPRRNWFPVSIHAFCRRDPLPAVRPPSPHWLSRFNGSVQASADSLGEGKRHGLQLRADFQDSVRPSGSIRQRAAQAVSDCKNILKRFHSC